MIQTIPHDCKAKAASVICETHSTRTGHARERWENRRRARRWLARSRNAEQWQQPAKTKRLCGFASRGEEDAGGSKRGRRKEILHSGKERKENVLRKVDVKENRRWYKIRERQKKIFFFFYIKNERKCFSK